MLKANENAFCGDSRRYHRSDRCARRAAGRAEAAAAEVHAESAAAAGHRRSGGPQAALHRRGARQAHGLRKEHVLPGEEPRLPGAERALRAAAAMGRRRRHDLPETRSGDRDALRAEPSDAQLLSRWSSASEQGHDLLRRTYHRPLGRRHARRRHDKSRWAGVLRRRQHLRAVQPRTAHHRAFHGRVRQADYVRDDLRRPEDLYAAREGGRLLLSAGRGRGADAGVHVPRGQLSAGRHLRVLKMGSEVIFRGHTVQRFTLLTVGILLCGALAAAGQTRPAAGGNQMPRTADGKPDFRGIWQAITTAAWDMQDHNSDLAGYLGVPPGKGIVEGNDIPYKPDALAQKKKNFEKRDTEDPAFAKCYLPGIPRANYMPYPFEILQIPNQVGFRYEFARAVRVVDLTGHSREWLEGWGRSPM